MSKKNNLLPWAIAAAAFYFLNRKNSVGGIGATPDYKNDVYPYILNSIDSDDYNEGPMATDKQKLEFLYKTFRREYSHAIQQMGAHRAFIEWMQGLPSSFHIDFENHEILKLAKKWGTLPANATERQEDKILNNWWNFLAVNTFKLFRKHKVI